MAQAHHTASLSISSTGSPATSLWSRGHSSKSSASSVSATSSPIQTRESFDLVGNQKRLEDVCEEDTLYSRRLYSFDDYRPSGADADFSSHGAYDFDQDHPGLNGLSGTGQGRHGQRVMRQQSLDSQPRRSVAQDFASRFGSLSRRWKNRSAIGPSLSIITNTTPLASPRSSLDVSVNCPSRTASIKSNRNTQGIYSPASMHSFVEESIPESEVVPIFIDQRLQSPDETEEFQTQATTPLLPPTMLSTKRNDSPIHSPLQSPAIAPTCYGSNTRLSMDTQPFTYLPSPPLSTRPSMVSMPRSRANTATQDIPALHLSSERFDPWAMKLGHADFSIYPEPYQPNIIDLDNYKEFRDNWDHARKQYAQHLARTIEHYGETSKVFKLTEEKWGCIDRQWKKYYDDLTLSLSPQLARLSDGSAAPDSPISLLEKPSTRVVVPTLDKSGKFPEIGDTDIVGPLTIGVAKVPELQRGNITPPLSPRRRNFIKALGDIFSRH